MDGKVGPAGGRAASYTPSPRSPRDFLARRRIFTGHLLALTHFPSPSLKMGEESVHRAHAGCGKVLGGGRGTVAYRMPGRGWIKALKEAWAAIQDLFIVNPVKGRILVEIRSCPRVKLKEGTFLPASGYSIPFRHPQAAAKRTDTAVDTVLHIP